MRFPSALGHRGRCAGTPGRARPAKRHGIPVTPENLDRFFSRYAFWLDHILAHSRTELCPGVWETIQGLQTLSEPPILGLLTGNIRLGAEIKLRHFGLWDVFQTGAFADDHEDRDGIASVALERGKRISNASLKPEEVLVVGDTPLDIRCGRAIGAKVLAVATGGSKLKELKAHQPDWAVADLLKVNLREVAGR